MNRPKHWELVMSGVTLLTMTTGCRSTHSKIPPEPKLATAPSQVQFSSDPPPATGPAMMGGMGSGRGINATVLPGQAPGATHSDVPMSGLGSPTPQAQSPIVPPSDTPAPVTPNPN